MAKGINLFDDEPTTKTSKKTSTKKSLNLFDDEPTTKKVIAKPIVNKTLQKPLVKKAEPKKSLIDNVGDFLNKNFSKTVSPTHTNIKANQSVTFDKKKLDKASGTAGAFTANLVDSATLGLATKGLNKLEKGLGDKALADASKGHKVASTVGNLAGYILPGTEVGKLAKPIVKKVGGKVAQKIVKGTIEGGTVMGAESAIRGHDIKTVAKDTLIGGGLGIAGEGASAVIGKIASKALKPRPLNEQIITPKETPKVEPKLNRGTGLTGKLTRKPIAETKPLTQPTTLKATEPLSMTSTGSNNGNAKNLFDDVVEETVGKQKVAKTRSNTFERTKVISDTTREMFPEEAAKYTPEQVTSWAEQASKNVANNRKATEDAILNNAGSLNKVQQHEAAIIASEYEAEALATGDSKKYVNFLKSVTRSNTEAGRNVKAIDSAWDKKTKTGAIMDAVKTVDKVEEGIKKTNPAKIKQIDAETKQVEDALNNAHKDTVNEIANELSKKTKSKLPKSNGEVAPKKEPLSSEILAKKIQNAIKPKTPKEKSMIDKMISELYGVAKESPIKIENTKLKPNPLNTVADSLKNRELYATVWNNAKEIVKTEFKDNPEAAKVLNDYFEKGIRPPFSMSKFNSAYNQGVKDLNINMGDVVKNYYKTGTSTKQGLIDHLVKNAGLSGDEATTLANTIDTKFRTIKKQKAEAYLQGIFKEKPKANKTNNALGNIEALSNTGGFVNENYKAKVMGKLTPELQKIIGYTPKETVAKVVDKSAMSFEDIVRGGVGKIGVQKSLFLKQLQNNLKVNSKDAETILKAANEEFSKLAKDKQTQILNNMLKPKTKSTQKSTIDKVMELINLEAYDKESIRDLIKQKEGLPILDSNDVKFISEHMDKAATFPEGSIEQRTALSKVHTLIENKKPSTIIEKSRALRNISLLTNTGTAAVNNIGNALMGTADNVANIVGVPMSKLMQRKTGFATHAMPSGKILAKGFGRGLKEQAQDSLGGLTKGDLKGKTLKQKVNVLLDGISNPINTSHIGGEKFEGSNRSVFKSKPMKVAENIQKTVITDRPFEEAHYADLLNQLKKGNKTDVATDEMKKIAENVTKERTYKDDNKLGKLATSIRNAPKNNLDPGAVTTATQIGFDSIVPYVKTPVNIVKRGIEYTPAGILEGVAKYKHAVKTDTLDMAKQREIIDRISRGIVGTFITGGGIAAGVKGVSTPSADKDYQVAMWNKSIGKQGNAIKIGDKETGYSKLQPISMPFSIGANIANKKDKYISVTNAVLEALTDSMDFYADQPMLQSLQKFLGSKYDNKGTSQRVMEALMELPKQYIPTILKQVRQGLDDYARETHSSDKLTNNLLNPAKDKVPGASKSLPKKIDIRGEETKNFQDGNSLRKIIANPLPTTKEVHSPGINMINKLYESTVDKGVLPNLVDKKISITQDGKTYKVPLNGEELSKYQKFVGKTNMKVAETLATNKDFMALSDENKAKALKEYYGKLHTAIKLKMLMDIAKSSGE